MSIEDDGVVLFAGDFEETPEKSTAVVLKLAIKRSIAMVSFMRLVELEKPES
jgi:hypothetical protein